jgi:hypothetical protein
VDGLELPAQAAGQERAAPQRDTHRREAIDQAKGQDALCPMNPGALGQDEGVGVRVLGGAARRVGLLHGEQQQAPIADVVKLGLFGAERGLSPGGLNRRVVRPHPPSGDRGLHMPGGPQLAGRWGVGRRRQERRVEGLCRPPMDERAGDEPGDEERQGQAAHSDGEHLPGERGAHASAPIIGEQKSHTPHGV